MFAFGLNQAKLRLQPKSFAKGGSVSVLALVGLTGSCLYVLDFSTALSDHGIAGFFWQLSDDPLQIRGLAEENRSIGTQLSYFGWISAAMSAHRLGGRMGVKADALNIILTLVTNLAFIDRTRPLWIALSCGLAFVAGRDLLNPLYMLRWMALIVTASVAFFIGFVLLTGKGADSEGLDGATFSFLHYLTAGPAYFSHMLDNMLPTFSLGHLLTPAFTVVSSLTESKPPPSTILELVWIPHPTNVGTGLEPFFMAAGWPGIIFGLWVYAFLFNALSVFFLLRGGSSSVLAWGHLCFASLLLFFVPKVNNTALWLFLIWGLIFSHPITRRLIERRSSPKAALV